MGTLGGATHNKTYLLHQGRSQSNQYNRYGNQYAVIYLPVQNAGQSSKRVAFSILDSLTIIGGLFKLT